MNQGECLCGKLSWEFTESPEASYHCHCSMCRKVHGATFATYYLIPAENFSWTSATQTLKAYDSSAALARCFCADCGSVVPDSDSAGDVYFVPAGSHQQGPKIDAHIFTASCAPWHDIKDDLPQFKEFAHEDDGEICTERKLSPKEDGVVRGSCLCNAVQYELDAPFNAIHNCHCSRCRRARAAAHTTNGFLSIEHFRWIQGEDNTTVYKVPDAQFFTHAFCKTCGSGTPRADSDRQIAIVPLGTLDDDPGQIPNDHIYVKDKADWYHIGDDLPQFDKGPE